MDAYRNVHHELRVRRLELDDCVYSFIDFDGVRRAVVTEAFEPTRQRIQLLEEITALASGPVQDEWLSDMRFGMCACPGTELYNMEVADVQ